MSINPGLNIFVIYMTYASFFYILLRNFVEFTIVARGMIDGRSSLRKSEYLLDFLKYSAFMNTFPIPTKRSSCS